MNHSAFFDSVRRRGRHLLRRRAAALSRCALARREEGLTLLELLVVVFILAAISFVAVEVTNNADEQARFEDTRRRLELMRTAVVGDPSVQVNGEPAVGGFVADMGRLPNAVQELVEQGSLPSWSYTNAFGLYFGWRGPYVPVTKEQSGTSVFRDGWGNPDSTANYGWRFDVLAPTNVLAQSLGSDWTNVAASGYAADYPPSGALVEQHDHQLNVRNWSTVAVQFVNPSNGGPALPAGAETVRLRLYYPFNWTNSWPATDAARDATVYLSLANTLAAGAVPEGGSTNISFTFGTATNKFVPWGVRSMGVVSNATGNVFVSSQQSPITLVPRAQLPNVTLIWNLE